MEELIATFTNRFINHVGAYYKQRSNGTGYAYTAVYEPITDGLIQRHLGGYITIAVPALDENNNGRWIMFDADNENGALNKLGYFLDQWCWHTIHEGRRKGRDGHLWLLLDAPIAGEHLCNLASAILKLAGIQDSGIEIFPKQAKIPNKLGSAARLPLGIHRKPGADNSRGLFESCLSKDIESQLAWLSQQPLNNANVAIELAKEHSPINLPPIKRYVSNMRSDKLITFDAAVKLTSAKQGVGGWWLGHCPTTKHKNGDRHASLSIREGSDGVAVFNCFCGCTANEIASCLRR
jgi:hypothetical protein